MRKLFLVSYSCQVLWDKSLNRDSTLLHVHSFSRGKKEKGGPSIGVMFVSVSVIVNNNRKSPTNNKVLTVNVVCLSMCSKYCRIRNMCTNLSENFSELY